MDKDKTKRTAKIKAKVNSTASRLMNGTLEVFICNFSILIITPTIPLWAIAPKIIPTSKAAKQMIIFSKVNSFSIVDFLYPKRE